jgi:pyruvate dehydrogenase E2 component (dihydrolipoamide acetyltransferase)
VNHVPTGVQVEVLMPQMGVTVFEATVVKWLKLEGDPVAVDEPLLEIETDKVDTEVTSQADGVLARILVQEGETVAVGARIAVIAPPGVEVVRDDDGAESEPTPSAKPSAPPTDEPAPRAVPSTAPAPPSASGDSSELISPVAQRMAGALGIRIADVPGTGRGGRVTKKDILAYAERAGAEPPSFLAEGVVAGEFGDEVLEPASQMRRLIAKHMRRSLDASAHVTTVFEVDMSRVVEIRDRLKAQYATTHGVRLTYLPLIARATIDALQRWPWLNGELRGDTIVTKPYVNLGVAVALDDGKGLVVPVVKNAERLDLLGLARAITEVAERARTKRLRSDDVEGGSFTITNPGGYGSILATPIINQPQVGILDVEAIVHRVVAVGDERGNLAAAIRPMMNLCLSFDHRLVDGAYAAQFLRQVQQNLQTWDESEY